MLSAGQITQMKATNAGLMSDTCAIGIYSGASFDSHGQPTESWSYGSAIACGFNPNASIGSAAGRTEPGELTVTPLNAQVRLPIGTTVNVRDRVKVTKKNGATLPEDLVFEVVSFRRQGPAGILLDLQLAAS